MMDRKQQRQVWQRVYAAAPKVSPVSREGLRQSYRRLQQNLQFYEAWQRHSIYGPAFSQLARQTREQMQMLQQILEGQG